VGSVGAVGARVLGAQREIDEQTRGNPDARALMAARCGRLLGDLRRDAVCATALGAE
jgi:hypothetical protein